MERPYQVAPDICALPSWEAVPTLGFLAINAFVLKAKEPVLVDTGMWIESEAYLSALESVIDPKDVRWVFLTHDDNDHKGSVERVLTMAPRARLVTSFIAAGRMMDTWRVPLDRCYLLNPGESLSVGDRTLRAVRPPLWDSPPTVGYYDDTSGAFFSGDCFGAFIPSQVHDAAEIPEKDLAQAVTTFASIMCPWVHMLDDRKFLDRLNDVRSMAPKLILSGHLPPAHGSSERFLKWLAAAPGSQPWEAPNQAALEALMAGMGHGGPPPKGSQ